jgi:hypothetical protein
MKLSKAQTAILSNLRSNSHARVTANSFNARTLAGLVSRGLVTVSLDATIAIEIAHLTPKGLDTLNAWGLVAKGQTK